MSERLLTASDITAIRPYYTDDAVSLFLGSCLDVLPTIDLVDHVITDPPYARDVYVRALGNNIKKGSGTPDRLYKGQSLAKLAAGDIGNIDEMLEPVAGHIARITQRWAIVYSDAETTHRWKAALERRGPLTDGFFEWEGMRYVRTGAWVKPDSMPQMTGDRPAVGFEPCTICHALGPMRWNGGGKQAVWTYFTAKGHARPDHPCPKPLPLMTEMIEQFTDPGELILDPFAGSGTTLVAAKLTGRRAIGIEINEQYAEVAAKRLQQTWVVPEAIPAVDQQLRMAELTDAHAREGQS